MIELRGSEIVNKIIEQILPKIASLKENGIIPTLAIVRIGENKDDLSYEKSIIKRFTNNGAEVEVNTLPETVKTEDVVELVEKLNANKKINGILIFRPFPKHIDEEIIKKTMSEEKDIDCMSDISLAKVFLGVKNAFAPCTAQAVVEMLEGNDIEIEGKKVVIVGRSAVVGKPLSMLLLSRNATVTICHSRTADLQCECRGADILVSCIGRAKMIGKDYFSKDQVLIDVGINFDENGICGDMNYEEAKEYASMATPVPGGIGPITTAVLLKQLVLSIK